MLESAQAGLSWLTILRRRENYREAYAGFDAPRVAEYGPEEIEALLGNAGIIRNRKKIEASIGNARHFLEIQDEFGSFDKYLWAFVDGKPVVNRWKDLSEIPATAELSDRVTGDLRARGLRFIGSTIIYSHLQAVGVVNDHLTSCFRYRQIKGLGQRGT